MPWVIVTRNISFFCYRISTMVSFFPTKSLFFFLIWIIYSALCMERGVPRSLSSPSGWRSWWERTCRQWQFGNYRSVSISTDKMPSSYPKSSNFFLPEWAMPYRLSRVLIVDEKFVIVGQSERVIELSIDGRELSEGGVLWVSWYSYSLLY